MTSLLIALIAAVLAPEDLEKARADLKKAVVALNHEGVEDAVKRVAGADGKRAVEILLEGYSECAKALKLQWDEKLKVIAENQNAERYDRALDRKGQAVEVEIRKIEALKRQIVQALAAFRSDGAVQGLIADLKKTGSGDWTRRAGVAEALGQIDHVDAVKALIDVIFKDPEPAVRVAAMDGLRAKNAKSPEAVAVLILMLTHESWQVKSTAVATLQAFDAKEATENFIEALGKNDGRLRMEINDALIRFTGVDKHGDAPTWKAWWDANKEDFKLGIYKPAKGEGAGGQGVPMTTFYGIPVKSKHVVFILDRSGSMKEPSEWEVPPDVATGPGVPGSDIKKTGDRKIDIARWQLKKALAMLPDGTEFNLIFYNHQWTSMAETMVKLNPTTRKQATEFIDSLDPAGRTNIYDPLERGLMFAPGGMAGEKAPKAAPGPGKTVATGDRSEKGYADTVFLLSDGLPNTGQIPDPDGIIAKVKELNRTRKVTVNTIGVFAANGRESEGGGRLMKQLADDSGGIYTSAGKAAAKKP